MNKTDAIVMQISDENQCNNLLLEYSKGVFKNSSISTNKMMKLSLLIILTTFILACNKAPLINESEKEWLKQHPNLIVGISPNQPPYQFIDEKNEITGMFIDYLTIIEDRLDYKFKKRYQADWTKLLTEAKEGNVDVVLQIQETEERKEILNFTPVLISHKHVIVVKNSVENITSINDIKDKIIAVGNSYAIKEYLSKTYPDYSIIPYFDNVKGLRAVSTGQADAFICQQAVATYYIESEGISNLKIAGEIEYSNKLSIASIKNLDTLNTILTKAVNSITKTEKQNIYSNWLSYEVKPFYAEAKFWIVILLIILGGLILAILFNLALRKMVKQKTKELKVAKEKAEENEFLIQKQYQELSSAEEEIRTSNEELVVTADELKHLNDELLKAKEEAEEKYEQINDLEQRLQFALAASNTGAWDLDLIDHSATRTLQHDKIFGYETLLPKWTYEIFISHVLDCDKQQVNEKFNFAVQTKSYWSFECQIKTVKNKTRWIWACGQHKLDENGNIHRMAGIVQDITERKLIEQELNKTQILLKSSLESPKDMIILSIDKNYNYLYFNEFHKTSMLYAYQKDVKIGMNLLECITSEEDKINAKKNYDKALAGESHITVQEFGDIEKSYYETRYNPIFNDKNEIIGATAFSADITDRKLAEDKVREKDIQFRKLSANVSDLIFQFTRRLDGSYCVPTASEGIKNIFGCSPEDVVDDFTPIGRVIYPEDAERVIKDIEYSAEHLTFFTCEFRVQIPGKPIQWIFSRSAPEKLADGSVTWYGFNADITERKSAEELLKQQNQQLEQQYEEYMQLNEQLRITNYDLEIEKKHAEESDNLKTAFLRNMSHEIRTPLNGILGFTTLLRDDDISKDEIKEYTTIIQQSGNRLMETVGNVLDISKIETGQIEVQNRSFSINSMMADMFIFFTPDASTKKLNINYQSVLENEFSIILSDETKLNQILTNLINNAIKFTIKGNIDFGYVIKDSEIEFFVKDTGIGIPDEFKHRIFTRFAQVNLSISRGYEGAGLGLSICKGLVELLGGRIWFESEVDKGTSFFFTIPYSPITSINQEEINQLDIQTTNVQLKILIVEDDWTSFQYLNKLLSKSNYTLIHADNGEQAIEFVKKEIDIKLVLMDIRMPVMNGIDATKIIKELRPDLPIIAQTAYAFSSEKEEILSIGCIDYISKPISKDILFKLIEKYG